MGDRDDDEESCVKTSIKLCLSLIPAMLASIALFCGMLYGFWCESVQFEVDTNAVQRTNNTYEEIHFGLWGQLNVTVETADVPGGYKHVYNTYECVDFLYADPDMDAKWKATKAFAIITAILGGFLVVGLWFAPCLHAWISADTWNGCAMMSAVFLTLFQGLTFLFLRSVACTDQDVMNQIQGPYKKYYEKECSWDSGSTANVVAIVCWFFAGLFMCALGLPEGIDGVSGQTQVVTYEMETLVDGTQVKVVKGVEAFPQSDGPRGI